MTLAERIAARIRASGPITIADYMAECLFDPAEGYYATRQVFGQAGDFTTAPEISQMFGELIGLCLAQSWLDQGAPAPFTLAELGPGRGTLLADILRATRSVPGFHDALSLVLAEASPRLREVQIQTIGRPLRHVTTADELPDAPLFLVANEFFDALPIRQFVRQGNGWAERMIGLRDGALAYGLAAPTPLPLLAHRLEDMRDGDIVEVCPQAETWITPVADRIARHGGAALIIDYGSGPSLGDTFQALRAHQPVDPLATPGAADLTAHVDFVALTGMAQAAGVAATKITPQGDLLKALGIEARAARLAVSLTAEPLEQHKAALARLTFPEEMGTLFKALALYPKGQNPPPGFVT